MNTDESTNIQQCIDTATDAKLPSLDDISVTESIFEYTENDVAVAKAFFNRKRKNGIKYYQKNREKCLEKGRERRERLRAEGVVRPPRAKRVLSEEARAKKRERDANRTRSVDPVSKEERLLKEKEKRKFLKAVLARYNAEMAERAANTKKEEDVADAVEAVHSEGSD